MKRSHSNALLNGLTPGQERAIRAMLTARSIAAAARQANVGQSTLRRWLREDDNFETELHRYREEALCFASLILQRNLAWVVGLMYEFIKTDAPVPHGKVTLIRTAIEYAFRSAVYCDIVGRVLALERIQRQKLFAADNPPTAPGPGSTQNRTAAPDHQPASDSKQSTSQALGPQRANFRRSAHSCSNPAVKDEQILRQSAHNCSIRTPKPNLAHCSAVPPRACEAWSGQAVPSSTPQSVRMDKEYALFRPFSLPGMWPISLAKTAKNWRSSALGKDSEGLRRNHTYG